MNDLASLTLQSGQDEAIILAVLELRLRYPAERWRNVYKVGWGGQLECVGGLTVARLTTGESWTLPAALLGSGDPGLFMLETIDIPFSIKSQSWSRTALDRA